MSAIDTTTSAPRRLRADAARNRQALIDAARRLFATRGMSVTLDDIALEAGVNVATAYRHFANKRELIEVFLQQLVDRAVEVCERAAAADDPWDGIVGFFSDTVQLMLENRGLQDVFTPGLAVEWMEQLDQRVQPLIRRMLSRGQEAGCVRADLQPGDIGVVRQMLSVITDFPNSDRAGLTQRYLALLLDSLRPSESVLPGEAPSQHELRVATAAKSGASD